MYGLGPRIVLGLFAFVVVLGVATSALVYWGFDRAQHDASDRTREGLELQGLATLERYARSQSESVALQLAPAAEFAQTAARYMYEMKRLDARVPWDPATLELLPHGVLADPRPDRVTDVLALSPLTAESERNLRDSAVLDPLFPSLFAAHPGRMTGVNFQPIAVFFLGADLATRYYPPVGSLYEVDPGVDVTPLMQRLGPDENPDRRTIWTSPYEDEAGRGLVITAYTAAFEGDTLRGAIGVDLSIARLADQLDLVRPTPSGFAFYLDREGNLLPSGGADVITGEVDANNEAAATLIDEMAASGSGVARVALRGRDFYVAFEPLSEIGGSYAVAAPVDELTEEAATIAGSFGDQGDQTVLLLLAMLAGLFVFALLFSTLLTRRTLLKPIAELSRGTRKMAAGDYTAQIAVRSNDELGDLARSFNAMAAEVQQRNERLEERVRDRTSELEGLVDQRDQRVKELEAVAAIASSLTLRGDLESILKSVTERVVQATGAEACAVGVRAPADGQSVELVTHTGMDESDVFRLQAAWSGRAPDDTIEGPVGQWNRVLGMPVIYHGETAGVILACYSGASAPTPSEAAFLEAIADQTAVAIENSQLLEQSAAAAALAERQRLARELHDSVSQALYAIGLSARTAYRRLGPEAPAEVREPVEYVLSLAESGLTEMRALIFELRPESLAQEGLIAALGRQVAATRARWGIDIEARMEEEPDITLAAKEALYRIAQEALHNVVKHARASRITLTLDSDGTTVTMTVRDDGVGFNVDDAFPGHLGLQSMRERAAAVQGRLTVTSEEGSGTALSVNVPVNQEE